MESLSKSSDCRKRRRSSVENDIMEKRLQAWRAKKGLPILSKIQEEREKTKLLSKHTTPSHPLKRKSIQISKSEKKMERSDDKSKQARFYTPGPSTHHDVAIDRRRTFSNLQINKQPGRRSLAPSTRMNTPQQFSNSVKRNEGKKIAAGNKVPLLLNKSDKITTAMTQQVPIRSHDLSHVSLHTQGRKSVRFSSPKMSTAVEACDENIPVSCTPKVTPGPSKSKSDIRGRLEQWLIAKGKTPSRFNNFLGYESSLQHTTPGGGSHTRRRSGTPHLGRNRRDTPGKGSRRSGEGGAVHGTMKECLEMLEEGCPLEDMLAWLDGMVTKAPLIQQSAGYWLCRAKIAEKQGGDQSAIECLFEAVEFNPEPVKDILDTLATYRLKLKMSSEESEETRWNSPSIETGVDYRLRHSPCLEVQTPVAHLRFEEEDGNQSPDGEDDKRPGEDTSHLSIKYSLKETTPYFMRIHRTIGHSPPTPCLLVTPVRRSARLDNKRRSVACLGTQLTRAPAVEDCLDSMREVAANYPTAQLILRPNRALTQEFSEAQLQD
ncbi:cytoskeleton-associated protein 2-like [Strongylocentrotus purpuratus]|uniref:Cytoskeleton-associated protein 2 C-terminal domain-containing protein n=1 Tax=Strongylocentrotus purpuratus TaxID=7668 RepID=A0A7M7HEI7_STRPU|nr:cytoskeleton-associated protein 2-like [Strongylocentrotus purpuratus]|eukprot:XP_011662541.1 PREDICTED: cytoskeleton-associated protein 2-like [Strongylocentrotus purpuratus]